MANPLISQASYFALFGDLSAYQAKHAGQVQNPGEIRRFGDVAVDISGQAAYSNATTKFEAGPGVRTYRPETPGALLAPDTLAASVALQTDIPADAVERLKAGDLDPAFAGMISVPETVEIRHTPAAPETVSGPGFIPGDVFAKGRAAEADWFGRQIAGQGQLAQVEAELAKQYGDDIKLAYDPLGEDYLMLRPGQPGYDEVQSARDAFGQTGRDAWKLGHGNVFDEILRRYAVNG